MMNSKKYYILSLLFILNCATSYEKNTTDNLVVQTFRREYQNIHLLKGENGKYLMIDAGGYDSAPDLEKDIL